MAETCSICRGNLSLSDSFVWKNKPVCKNCLDALGSEVRHELPLKSASKKTAWGPVSIIYLIYLCLWSLYKFFNILATPRGYALAKTPDFTYPSVPGMIFVVCFIVVFVSLVKSIK